MAGITIAIDGPASSGKGTVARGVARALDYRYVDTGALYRAVALRADREGVSWDDGAGCAAVAAGLRFDFRWEDEVLRVLVDGEDVTGSIRTAEAGLGASAVSRHGEVRQALLRLQRELGAEGGVVMDGRDIGTVVLPEATLKIYLDADVEERARRRHEELVRRGDSPGFAAVRAQLITRDKQDMEREIAPLRAAEDAVRLDSTELTIPQAVDRVLAIARRRGA